MKVAERLSVLSSTYPHDAKSITDVILAEFTEAGLTSSKTLSQIYDGASAMAGHRGEVQRLLQERENRKISYVQCLNHQLRLVVVHAMSVEQAINDLLHIYGSLQFFSQVHSCTLL